MRIVREEEREFIRRVPKAELHLHLEGCVQFETLWRLYQKNGVKIPGVSCREDLRRLYDIKSLNQFVNFFINVLQRCFYTLEDLSCYIYDAAAYMKRNQVRYAEFFFAPSQLLRRGIPYEGIADFLQAGVRKLAEEGLQCSFLIDVSRSFGLENAMQNCRNVLTHQRPGIIGIGLGGNERDNPTAGFREVYRLARANGLRVVAHAGEDSGPESIWSAVRDLCAERIGHGTSAALDPQLMDYLKAEQIPLEICLTSNLFTKRFVSQMEEHPIRLFFERGLLVTLNSDDPTLFHSELTHEYELLMEKLDFSLAEVLQIMKNNIMYSFQDPGGKQELWASVQSYLSACDLSVLEERL